MLEIPYKGPHDAEMAFIGEYPVNEDISSKVPFSGSRRMILKAAEKQLGFDLKEILLGFVWKKPNRPEHMQPAVDRFVNGEVMSQPRRILFMGASLPPCFVGQKLDAIRGQWIKIGDCWCMFTFGLPFVQMFPQTLSDFSNDLEKFLEGNTECALELGEDGYPIYPYQIVTDAIDLEPVLESRETTIDIETNKKRPFDGKIFKIGIYNESYDFAHIISRETLTDPAIQKVLRHYLYDDFRAKIIHNGQFEYMWFHNNMETPTRNIEDTMLMHYALDERSGDDDDGRARAYHSLKVLAGYYFNLPDWSHLMKPWQEDFSEAPDHIVDRYLAVDLITTHKLYHKLLPILKQYAGPYNAYRSVMLKLIPLLADMTLEGFDFDADYMDEVDKKWSADLEQQIKEIQESVGYDININSPKQVAELFYDKMKLVVPKTVKGKRTNPRGTDKHIMKELQKQTDDPIVTQIKEARGNRHLRSTYIVGLPKKVEPSTGKIHTDLLIHGTDTGRLASRNPNLQNIPARMGPLIRNAFIAPEGWSIVDSDYKQLEFRVLALLSQDKKLIQFINDDRDIHSEVASVYFNIPYGTETDQQRIDAKAVVFGIIYGRTAKSIAEEYGLPVAVAKERQEIFFDLFPHIKDWIDTVQKFALENHYVESYYGRYRRFNLITQKSRGDVERYAVNSPIQGTASDICGLAAAACKEHFVDDPVKQLLLIHDGFPQIARDDYIHECAVQTKAIMENLDVIGIPESPVTFKIDIKVGKRWGSCEKYKIAS